MAARCYPESRVQTPLLPIAALSTVLREAELRLGEDLAVQEGEVDRAVRGEVDDPRHPEMISTRIWIASWREEEMLGQKLQTMSIWRNGCSL